MADEADNVSSVSPSACHIGGPIYVNPGELALVYGNSFLLQAATVPQEVVMELPVLIIAQQCLLQCVAPMEKRTATSVLWK